MIFEILTRTTYYPVTLSDLNQQVAASATEQTAVTSELDSSVLNISNLGDRTIELGVQGQTANETLNQLASNLDELIKRFKF